MEWKQVDAEGHRSGGGWFRGCLFAMIPTALLVMAIVLLLALLLIKLLWAWTVPDLFPKAVEAGYVAKTISWLTSFKLALFIAVLAGIAGFRRRG